MNTAARGVRTLRRLFSNVVVPLSTLGCIAGAAACGAAPDDPESVSNGAEAINLPRLQCPIPAYAAPTYVRPPSDAVAFGTLIDGAGYAGAGNSNWTDIASGNVCGGAEKELVLMKNAHSFFSILRGPVPYPVGTFDARSDLAHPWRGVATLDVDRAKDGLDEIVAVRHVTAGGVPDLVVMKASAACDDAKVIASATIGNPRNSDWVDVAVGDFDGTGKQIALLKTGHSNFFLVRPQGLTVSFISDLDTAAGLPWKQVAAGDLDGDGHDELVVARQVSDGKSPTVLVYKWSAGDFHLLATSTFGNTGNSAWTGMTVGDFNGDRHPVIALQKSEHSNFALLDLVKDELRELATNDLDSAKGQPWRGLTAVDWLGGDQGAQELVAVRAANGSYLDDLFVYGDPFQRALRDSALTKVKAQWDQHRPDNQENGVVDDWLGSVIDTHTNLVNVLLSLPEDYAHLVEMLDRTHNLCVDGKQIRVAVSIPPWGDLATDPARFNCAMPTDSPLTPWHERDEYFLADHTDMDRCKDVKEWGRLLGRLAQRYPQLVMFQVDDFMENPSVVPAEDLAEMQSNMRSQAPWMSFAPVAYYGSLDAHPDASRMVDTVVFFFKDDSNRRCIEGACGEQSMVDFYGEATHVASRLPAGRKLQVGFYYDALGSGPVQHGTVRYDHDLTLQALQMPELGGVTAYHMQTNPASVACPATGSAAEKYCVIKSLYPLFP
jgi:hypothetical protein